MASQIPLAKWTNRVRRSCSRAVWGGGCCDFSPCPLSPSCPSQSYATVFLVSASNLFLLWFRWGLSHVAFSGGAGSVFPCLANVNPSSQYQRLMHTSGLSVALVAFLNHIGGWYALQPLSQPLQSPCHQQGFCPHYLTGSCSDKPHFPSCAGLTV